MLVLALCSALVPQEDALARVRAAEQQRVEIMEYVAPAVVAVMPLQGQGGGSGVIFDPAGFVLTNFHVVQAQRRRGQQDDGDPAQKTMRLGLPDGTLQLADVLGIDPGSDLAVMLLRPREDGGAYRYARLGDSEQLLVGQSVFAMGNPFLLATDFVPTVTWGIVSGTHRYQGGGQNRFLVYPDCIQVDAPVNPGNSGGPLFDLHGGIVGINGRISVRDRGRVNTGVGFAIASNQIRNFLGDLMAGRHAEHGTIDLNAWYMTAPGGDHRGVFVQSTFADSIAGKLGVQLGDELLRFNGTEIRSANQLATLVGVLPAGSWVTLAYRPKDGGGEKEITFALPRLDTGSSRNPDRLAPPDVRRKARIALTSGWALGGLASRGARVTLHEADGATTLYRSGPRLRLERGGLVLVRTAEDAFAVEQGKVRELTAEETALLERELATNPWLGQEAERDLMLADALLAGGIMSFARPALRYELPGDGERQVFYDREGNAQGYRLRDPLRKGLVERTRHGEQLRTVVDGALQPPGRLEGPVFADQDLTLFRRPAR